MLVGVKSAEEEEKTIYRYVYISQPVFQLRKYINITA